VKAGRLGMSDLEKVKNFYKMVKRKVVLRWEGAGDARHACALLAALIEAEIPFEAQVHCFEDEEHDNYLEAESELAKLNDSLGEEQSYELEGGMDVTRKEKGNKTKVDIMFVRNIMPTGEDKIKSHTSDSDKLKKIHLGAIRNRRNSLRAGSGQLFLGMSGSPGLVTGADRTKLNSNKLFSNFSELNKAAEKKNFWVGKGKSKPHFDSSVQPMKNDGNDLGIKRTYYLVFPL